jgi:hypothetical protein
MSAAPPPASPQLSDGQKSPDGAFDDGARKARLSGAFSDGQKSSRAAQAGGAFDDGSGPLSGRRKVELLLVAALGAAVSLLVTGFVFGVDNNAFHLPITASMFDEPQFHSDPFMQSLRYFASGVWLLLRGSARYVDPAWLFLVLLYFSRWLSFVGFLLCGTLLGVSGIRQYAVLAGFLCFTVLLQGESAAGDGSMFINCFAQSEIANGTVLIALYHAVRARLDLTLVFVGATAFINVFMAAWLCIPLMMLAVVYWRAGRFVNTGLARQAIVGGAAFVALAAPPLYLFLSNPDFGRPVPFDYAAFIAFIYPYHFLPKFILLREYRALGVVALLGAVALFELGAVARPFLIMLLGMAVTYLLGIAAPFLSSSPFVLNLHLLREGVLLYLVAALAAGALVSLWLSNSERTVSRLFAPLLGAALCTTKAVVGWGIVVIVLERLWPARVRNLPVPRLDWVVLVVLAVGVWRTDIVRNWRDNATDMAYVSEMTEVGRWVNLNTPTTAIFLMPTEWQRKHSGIHPPPYTLEEREIVNAQGAFVYYAHRRLRGSFTEGAAVMWSSSFYSQWRPDIDAALRLHGVAERTEYAGKEGIGYVLLSCNEPDAADFKPVFRTARVCLFPAR